MVKLIWTHDRENFAYRTTVPIKNHSFSGHYSIALFYEDGNPYGKWRVEVEAKLDGFPRYFQDADAAKSAMGKWVTERVQATKEEGRV